MFSNKIVDSRLYSSTLQFTLSSFLKVLQGLDRRSWPFGNFLITFVTLAGVLTSLLNHGLTHIVFQWLDRITIASLVCLTLMPTLYQPFQMVHAIIFFGVLSFVWSKLNTDDDELCTYAHKTSHLMASWASLSLGH